MSPSPTFWYKVSLKDDSGRLENLQLGQSGCVRRHFVILIFVTFLEISIFSVDNTGFAAKLWLTIESVFCINIKIIFSLATVKDQDTVWMSTRKPVGASAAETQPPADPTSAAAHLCSTADSMVMNKCSSRKLASVHYHSASTGLFIGVSVADPSGRWLASLPQRTLLSESRWDVTQMQSRRCLLMLAFGGATVQRAAGSTVNASVGRD